ncbi:MAG TPA: cyclic nucleotide-binding domain-containing protein [Actinomycetota bacterium]
MRKIPRNVIEHFRKVPLFSAVSERGLRAIISTSDEISEPAGSVLVAEGDHRREFFVIVSGTARVTRRGRKVATVGPGDWFGEFALLAGVPRTATVTAETDVTLIMLGPQQLELVLDEEPTVTRAVLKALGERLHPHDRTAPG